MIYDGDLMIYDEKELKEKITELCCACSGQICDQCGVRGFLEEYVPELTSKYMELRRELRDLA